MVLITFVWGVMIVVMSSIVHDLCVLSLLPTTFGLNLGLYPLIIIYYF